MAPKKSPFFSNRNDQVRDDQKLICLAHRGGCGHAPENTMAAIQNAIAMGADWIEIDVRRADRCLIVIHDETLERTTSGIGPIADKSLTHLRSLDAGQGQQIPLLSEVLDVIKAPVGLNIEIKNGRTAVPVVEMVNAYIEKQRINIDQVLISSFNYRELALVHTLAPYVRLGMLFAGQSDYDPRLARQLSAYSVHLSLKMAKRQTVKDLQRHGFKVFVYTVNEFEDIARMRQLGVDGLFTDYPDRVLQY